MPDVFEGNTIPDPSEKPDEKPDTPGPEHVETAYAHGVGSSADPDGTHHAAAAPGEGEGTGIGSSGDSSGTPD